MPQTFTLGMATEHLALAALPPQKSWLVAVLGTDSMMLAMACLMPAITMLVQPERCFVSLVKQIIRAMPVTVVVVCQLRG